jgi:glycosyltransferase involved in cell wall biosynthesis
MKLAIVGIRGLPNNYGGFETLAEYLVEYLANDIEITVYCSSVDMPGRQKMYKGATLKYIPITSHGGMGIIYDSISLMQAVLINDKVLFLGFGAGFIVPLLQIWRRKIILNIGGLDWKRNKWSPRAQKIIKRAERFLIKYSGKIISDNIGIQQYIEQEYGKRSVLIPYGGDQAQLKPITLELLKQYPFLDNNYAFSVTRIQQDNNIDMMLNAFENQMEMPFVIVGNWSNSKYGENIKIKYSNNANLILLDAIYDRNILDVLRSNCTIYIHGHSAGGTNPSLAEAMFLGLPIFAYASGYNEYTTENRAIYFKDSDELFQLVNNRQELDLKRVGLDLKEIADREYRWSIIADKYQKIIKDLS